MKFFMMLIHFDGSLLQKFAQLCKGFRKHLLFEFKKQMEPAITSFKNAYGEFLEFDSVRLWTNKITFGG